MNVRTAVLLLFTCLQIGITVFAQAKHSNVPEQTRFSAEDPAVKKPVPIPDQVLAILKNDERVRNFLDNEDSPSKEPSSSWFSASSLHLSQGTKPDLIVVGEPPIAGANTAPFWVFRSEPQEYKLVLSIPAHDFKIKENRSHGYRDIEVSAVVTMRVDTLLFRFDGKQYVKYREKIEDPL